MHLDRLITILEAVAIAGRPISATEVHKVTKLPKPTCYRLLQDLADHRLVDGEAGRGRFILGARFKRIALLGQTDADVRLAAAPVIKDAAIDGGDAFFLSRFRDTGVEIIHVETPEDPAASYIHPGLGFRPMHACSCSKVIAAFSDDAFQDSVVSGSLRAYTGQTKTSPEVLKAEFEAIRRKGFAECVEEIEVGISSVAAPIRFDDVGVPFSIGAIGSVRRFTEKRRREIGVHLQEMAQQIAVTLRVNYLGSMKPGA